MHSRSCLAVLRSVLSPTAAASTILNRSLTGQQLRQTLIYRPVVQSRQKHHETMFDNIFESPIDQSKVQIDQVLKGFGERGIRRNGDQVTYQDMFKLFQLEDKYLISESKLHREWIRLQRALHPDKFLRVDRTSKLVSDQLSALVNEAYETLRHPYKRALYYMRLKANKSESEIESALDGLKMEPQFLSRMMDLREEINSTHDHAKQFKMSQELQLELDQLMLQVNRDFELSDYESALNKLGQLKFVANCHIALTDKIGSFSNF